MAIINGNAVFATLNNNQFYIDGALQYLPPVYGYAVTQAAYDQLTPEAGIYYAIISTATGESIIDVQELTQAQYDGMSTHNAATLYIISNGGSISDVFVGDTECDKLYQGSTELWERIIPPAVPQILLDAYVYFKARIPEWEGQPVFSNNFVCLYYDDLSTSGTIYFYGKSSSGVLCNFWTPPEASVSAICQAVRVTFSNGEITGYGYTDPMYNTRSIAFPAYPYNNGLIIPSSSTCSITKQGEGTITTAIDWTTGEIL